MRSDWPSAVLSDLVDERGVTYGVVQPGKPVVDGVSILRVNNFKERGLVLSDVLRIDPAIAARFVRSALKGGEVLITLVGTVGLVAIAPAEVAGWNVARAVGVIPIADVLLARWVALSLEAPTAKQYLDARLNTTVQSTLNLRDLASTKILLPPRAEMKRIVAVLGTLDAKANANDVLAARLAEIAIASARGLTQSGGPTIEVQLDDVLVLHRQKVEKGSELPYLGLDKMPRGSTVLSAWKADDAPTGDSYEFAEGDLLFGKLRPYFRKAGVATFDGRCSGEILVLRPTRPELFGFGVATIASDAFIAYANAVSSGTRMPRSEWKALKTFRCTLPTGDEGLEALNRQTALAQAAYEQISALVAENNRLKSIRRALLPELVSGRRQVPDSYDPTDALGDLCESEVIAEEAVAV